MEKKLKFTIIIGFAVVLAVPSIISLGYVIKNTGIFNYERLIDVSDSTQLIPTPNSNITLGYLIQEKKMKDHYHYDFEFMFTILQGIELNFTYNERLFNETQLYLTIKANCGLIFYTFFYVLNMTEFLEIDNQVMVQKEMDSSKRFENVDVKIHHDSLSKDEHMGVIIGGAKTLYSKHAIITTENTSHFTGTMLFWINDNSYNLSYSVTSNYLMNYTLDSFVTNLELYHGYIQIVGTNGTAGSGIGLIEFPCSPWATPGNYSSESYKTFSGQYPYICFEFNVGVNLGGAEVEYEIIPLSEIKDIQRAVFRNTILIATGSAILLYIIVLSCMINQESKHDAFWYRW